MAPPEKDKILLLVDDDALNLTSITRRFRMTRWRVITFDDPLNLAEYVRRGDPFDAIVSDFKMPQATGVELYAMVAAQLHGRPFVIQTGNVPSQIRRVHHRTIPADLPILSKPVTEQDLLPYIEPSSSPHSD